MNSKKIVILLLFLPILFGFVSHKFYVSITKIEYVKEQESVQIITKLFIDDIEQVLRERYTPSITLVPEKETEADIEMLKDYIFKKFKILVNGQSVEMNYIGKEYDIDIMKVYIEIQNIKEVHSIEIENKILMDLFDEQQNIIHYKYQDQRKNLILDVNNTKGVLNFD